jgi:catecholate siderophore receptor
MAGYAVHKNVSLQLNVQNVFDKEYIGTLNNNGSRYQPGAPRTFTLAANFLF